MIDISTDDTFDGMFFTTEWSTQECPVSSPALSDGLHKNVPFHHPPSAMVYTRMSRFIARPRRWSTRECPDSSPALSDGLHENVPIHRPPSAMVYTRMSRFIARPRRWSTRECPDSSPALGDGLHENVPFHHPPSAMVYTRMSRFIARPRRWSTRECPVSSPALSDGLHENVPIHRPPSAMVYTRMSLCAMPPLHLVDVLLATGAGGRRQLVVLHAGKAGDGEGVLVLPRTVVEENAGGDDDGPDAAQDRHRVAEPQHRQPDEDRPLHDVSHAAQQQQQQQ